jgi:hypothetical protein
LIEDNARELFSTVTVAAAAIFTPPYPVRIMSYTRIYLAVAFLYLATVQLPFSAANNQVSSHFFLLQRIGFALLYLFLLLLLLIG